jgi:hypothetical protein
MGPEPDYSRAALARFIEFVVEKGLVHPATAQGWRVATAKVLEELSAEDAEDVRRIDLPATFRAFLNRNPGRLSPASIGEYRRRVGRAFEEFVRWAEDPGGYAFRPAGRPPKTESRPRPNGGRPEARAAERSALQRGTDTIASAGGIALEYPLRPDRSAQVVVPRDLTVDEARRMGAFLLTLAVDFRPPGTPDAA